MARLSEPRLIERSPSTVVGAYGIFEGPDEGPAWSAAEAGFWPRIGDIGGRLDGDVLGFLYRPHVDHPEIPEDARACFVGVAVGEPAEVPDGLVVTHLEGGRFVVVDCEGDDPEEAAEGIGEAIGYLSDTWLPENGYVEGDACFAAGTEAGRGAPYVETVWMKVEAVAGTGPERGAEREVPA